MEMTGTDRYHLQPDCREQIAIPENPKTEAATRRTPGEELHRADEKEKVSLFCIKNNKQNSI